MAGIGLHPMAGVRFGVRRGRSPAAETDAATVAKALEKRVAAMERRVVALGRKTETLYQRYYRNVCRRTPGQRALMQVGLDAARTLAKARHDHRGALTKLGMLRGGGKRIVVVTYNEYQKLRKFLRRDDRGKWKGR